jgi:hypothetical protein
VQRRFHRGEAENFHIAPPCRTAHLDGVVPWLGTVLAYVPQPLLDLRHEWRGFAALCVHIGWVRSVHAYKMYETRTLFKRAREIFQELRMSDRVIQPSVLPPRRYVMLARLSDIPALI